jgi:hypothetical protein
MTEEVLDSRQSVAPYGWYFASHDDERMILREVQKFSCFPRIGNRKMALEECLKKGRSLLLG